MTNFAGGHICKLIFFIFELQHSNKNRTVKNKSFSEMTSRCVTMTQLFQKLSFILKIILFLHFATCFTWRWPSWLQQAANCCTNTTVFITKVAVCDWTVFGKSEL